MKKFLHETFALLSLLLCLCMLAGCGAESNPSQEEGTTESSPIAQEIPLRIHRAILRYCRIS